MAVEFIVRDTMAKVGDAANLLPASIDKYGNVKTIPWVYDLMIQGRVWYGGCGIEETDVDGHASLDDLYPTYMLRAPDAGTIVVPLFVRLQITTEGGAAPDAYLTLVNTNSDTNISLTSGTAANVVNALGGLPPASSAAKFYNTVTVAAITSTQNIVLWQSKDMPDNLLSAEAVGTGTPVETVNGSMSTVNIPLYPHMPIGLAKGSMMAFYTATGTSDSKWRPTFVWAEIPQL